MPSSVWKGYLSFGLVTFPVHLSTAARPQAVHFHMLHRTDLSRVKEVWYCAEEDKPIDRKDMVKGYEVRKGEYVVVDDEDLKRIAPATSSAVDILQFVRADAVDPVFLEKSYYVIPESGAEKPYVLLTAAMKEAKYYALGKVAMHAREHIVLIRPHDDGLMLHTMYFESELNKSHNAGDRSSKTKASANELKLARQLIESLAAPFQPQSFEDEYQKNVARMVEQKQKGQKIAPAKQPKRTAVLDIAQALKESLKQSASRATPASKRSGARKKSTAA